MNDGKKGRRRRSSSLLYQEPPESIEHMSDQSVLPNLNANWVNSKGEQASYSSLESRVFHIQEALRRLCSFPCTGADTEPIRCMGSSSCPHHSAQDPLCHHSRRLPRNIMDPYKHYLHVRLLSYVPLRAGSPL